jgi:hypothetical protein
MPALRCRWCRAPGIGRHASQRPASREPAVNGVPAGERFAAVAVALDASHLRLVRLLFRAIQDDGNPLDVPAHDDRSETRQELLVHGSSSAIAVPRLKLADVVPEAVQAFLVARSARVPYHVFLLNRSAPAIAEGHSGRERRLSTH